MNPIQLANEYMEIFFSGKDLNRLEKILHKECKFTGPFYQFRTSREYIDQLKKDPPNDFNYEIIKSYQDENSACLIYKFIKPLINTFMAQIFEVSENRITSIKLIFDTRIFQG
jgi:hypothetical protein